MEYKITLTHTEVIYIDAGNESDAIHQAYKQAEYNCIWDECEIESLDEE